jgi:signal transduction histidine kinase
VGQSLESRDRALRDLSGVLLLGGPLALLLASLAGYGLTGAALRPVEDMRRQTETISATNLGGRLAPGGGNDELGRLGRTLNEMLVRIQSAVAHERTFVADASHELRSPLAMLRMELELIARDAPTGEDLQRAVRSAVDETGRLGQLADDLLLLTRADENQLAMQAARVDARELLDAAAARARRQSPSWRTEITVQAAPASFVVADEARMAQALDNLLANAVRYAALKISLSAEVRNGDVELHVRDDGPGFPADFLPSAWTRFARADHARTEDGAGLGLAIVQTIAELHGASAHAENRAPHGADVWIALPRAP